MKKNILFFILGLIVMGGISTLAYQYNAKQVSFTPNDKNWNVKTVEEAINYLKNNSGSNNQSKIQEYEDKIGELEDKIETYENKISTYESKISELESNASSNQTTISQYEYKISELEGKIETANKKIEKYEEQIEELSTYKKLDVETTVSENNLLSGITAYDNSGKLITGNLSTDCASGIYNKPANKQISITLPFTPTKFLLSSDLGNNPIYQIYDESISNNTFIIYNDYTSVADYSSEYYKITNGISSNIPVSKTRYIQAYKIYYMACK